MSKKVMKSSNRNEKLRMVLSNNLKDALDIERILSDLNIKMNIKTLYAIGCAGIIASCGKENPEGESGKDQNKLKWDDYKGKNKFKDKEQFNKFLEKCEKSNLSKEEIEKLIEKLDEENVKNVLDGKLKKENGKITIDGKAIKMHEPNPETSATFSDFDKLSEKQKETLKEYGITDKKTLEDFLNIEDNKEFKSKNISELFNGKDIKDDNLKNKLVAYKNSKEDNEVKGILKSIMSETDISSFLNYVKYINDKLENIQNSIFNDIKANKGKEKELKDKIKKFCEKYVKSDNKINYEDISKIKNIILINLIKEDIKAKLEEGQNVDNLTFTYSKGDNCIKLKIVHKDDKNKTKSKSVELEIQFDSEELFKLKEKEGKEIQLYRIKDGDEGIKYNVDEKATEIKNLFPAGNGVKDTIEENIKSYQVEDFNTYAELIAELKKIDDFIENLTKGKDLKGNQIQGVSKPEDLHKLYGDKNKFDNAINKLINENILKEPNKGGLIDKIMAKINTIPELNERLVATNGNASPDIEDILKIAKENCDCNKKSVLDYLNEKCCQKAIEYFGDNNFVSGVTVLKFKQNGMVDEFTIGTEWDLDLKDKDPKTEAHMIACMSNLNFINTGTSESKVKDQNSKPCYIILKPDGQAGFRKPIDWLPITNKLGGILQTTLKMRVTNQPGLSRQDHLVEALKLISSTNKISNFINTMDTTYVRCRVTAKIIDNIVDEMFTETFGDKTLNKNLFDALKDLGNCEINNDACASFGFVKYVGLCKLNNGAGAGKLDNFTVLSNVHAQMMNIRKAKKAIDDESADGKKSSDEWKNILTNDIFGQADDKQIKLSSNEATPKATLLAMLLYSDIEDARHSGYVGNFVDSFKNIIKAYDGFARIKGVGPNAGTDDKEITSNPKKLDEIINTADYAVGNNLIKGCSNIIWHKDLPLNSAEPITFAAIHDTNGANFGANNSDQVVKDGVDCNVRYILMLLGDEKGEILKSKLNSKKPLGKPQKNP